MSCWKLTYTTHVIDSHWPLCTDCGWQNKSNVHVRSISFFFPLPLHSFKLGVRCLSCLSYLRCLSCLPCLPCLSCLSLIMSVYQYPSPVFHPLNKQTNHRFFRWHRWVVTHLTMSETQHTLPTSLRIQIQGDQKNNCTE